MGKFRDGMPVTAEAVTLILSSIDRIKEILAGLEATEAEPEGNDRDLIDQLEAMVERGVAAMTASPVAAAPAPLAPAPAAASPTTQGTPVQQSLEGALRPGEVSLDELGGAFRETTVDAAPEVAEAPAPTVVEKSHEANAAPKESRSSKKMSAGAAETDA